MRLGESVSPSSADSPDADSDSDPWYPSGCSAESHCRGCRCCWARQKSSRSSGLVVLGKGSSAPQLCGPPPPASFSSLAQVQRRRGGPFPRPGSDQWTSVPELAIGPGWRSTWTTSPGPLHLQDVELPLRASESPALLSTSHPACGLSLSGTQSRDSINPQVPFFLQNKKLPAGTLGPKALVQLLAPSP